VFSTNRGTLPPSEGFNDFFNKTSNIDIRHYNTSETVKQFTYGDYRFKGNFEFLARSPGVFVKGNAIEGGARDSYHLGFCY